MATITTMTQLEMVSAFRPSSLANGSGFAQYWPEKRLGQIVGVYEPLDQDQLELNQLKLMNVIDFKCVVRDSR